MILSDRENSAAKNFMVSSVIWLVIGVTLGITLAIKFFQPTFLQGTGYLQFGRLRPMHLNAVLFGWLSMQNIAAMFYIVPRLTRTKLHSEPLGNLAMIVWNAGMVLGIGALDLGYTQGKEFEELFWPTDIILGVALVLVAYNLLHTIAARVEQQLYVTLWYYAGSALWIPLVYLVGNLPFYKGVNDANTNWFYGHNVLGLWFTTVGVGTVYFLLPMTVNKPLYSHKLSLIGFWTIALTYVWVGAHHLIGGPVPYWLQTVAIIFSVSLLVPVFTVVTNFFQTMKGEWGVMETEIPVKFFVAGTWWYFLTCLQGPFQALRTVSQYVHFSNWTIGHAHIALFGGFSFIGWAMVYYVLPKILGRELYSRRLAQWHFWLSLVGVTGFFLSLTALGLIQGAIWSSKERLPFMASVLAMPPFFLARLIFGAMMFSAQYLFLINVLATIFKTRPSQAKIIQEVPA